METRTKVLIGVLAMSAIGIAVTVYLSGKTKATTPDKYVPEPVVASQAPVSSGKKRKTIAGKFLQKTGRGILGAAKFINEMNAKKGSSFDGDMLNAIGNQLND